LLDDKQASHVQAVVLVNCFVHYAVTFISLASVLHCSRNLQLDNFVFDAVIPDSSLLDHGAADLFRYF